jgi:outer membrane murein-binding lipoprotein Lpp
MGGFKPNVFNRNSGRLLVWLAALMLLAGCSAAKKTDEELNRDIHSLKAEIAGLKEKLAKLEADQQAIWEMLKKYDPGTEASAQKAPSLSDQPLTVSQLIADKDRLLGARVKVKGLLGPVVVHHKTFVLRSPGGTVEVFFGNLDEKLVQRLASQLLDQPVTVTGSVNLPPKGGAKLAITAEAVDF